MTRIWMLPAAGVLALGLACSPQTNGTSHAAAAKPSTPAAAPANVEQGKAIYKVYCASCHGDSGKGDGPAAGVLKPPPRDHTDYAYMSTLTDEDMARTIKMGGAAKGKPLMPSHPHLKEGELKSVVAYVRSLSAPAQ
jgi:mono/diheme cytochrome c family protein